MDSVPSLVCSAWDPRLAVQRKSGRLVIAHPAREGSSKVGQLWSLQQGLVDLREHSTAADVIEGVWGQPALGFKGTNRKTWHSVYQLFK